MAETSQFLHDCAECRYLGRFKYEAGDASLLEHVHFDLYVHPGEGRASELTEYVARYGDDGPEYSAFPDDVVLVLMGRSKKEQGPYSAALIEARNRCKERVSS